MRRVFALGFVYFLYCACSAPASVTAEPAAAPSPSPNPAPSALAEGSEAGPAPAGSASASPPKKAPDVVKTPPEAAKPKVANQSSADVDDSACPEGMQLV